MKKAILFLVCCILVMISCKQNKNYKATVTTLEALFGKQIIFFNNDAYHINTIDTIISPNNNFEYTVVMYADPSDCESCVWKFEEWYLKRKELLHYNKNIDFKFILQSKDYAAIDHYLFHAMPNIPVIYDPDGIFIEKNGLPLDLKYHTFLLNKKNEIILVGSPVGNDDLWSLYKKTVSKHEK